MCSFSDSFRQLPDGTMMLVKGPPEVKGPPVCPPEAIEKTNAKTCPFCNNKFTNISCHLPIHGVTPEEVTDICYSLRKRKPCMHSGRKLRKCPYPECANQDPYPRLDKHLRSKHKLTPADKQYQALIAPPKAKVGNEKNSSGKRKVEYSEFSEQQCSEYTSFLMTLSGGNLDQKAATQQGQKLRQILHGMSLESLSDATSKESMDALERWTEDYVERNSYSSGKTYLFIYSAFLHYLHQTRKVNITDDDIKVCEKLFAKWRHYFGRKSVKGVEDDCEITPEEIAFFEASDVHAEAIQTLQKKRSNFTMEEHTLVRNFLLLKSLLGNFHRSCVLYELTVEEFLLAKEVEDDGEVSFVIPVKKHKTNTNYGAAQLVLEKPEYELYKLYYKNFRLPMPSISRGKLILSLFILFISILLPHSKYLP